MHKNGSSIVEVSMESYDDENLYQLGSVPKRFIKCGNTQIEPYRLDHRIRLQI